MAGIPTGTVTFLFTDIEGSTKLARENPGAWETARARHHAILRGAIESPQGYVFQIIGDAFCAAFHTAADAMKAALHAQQSLQSEPWGEVPIRVRMGIHTGEAQARDGEYHGYLTMSLVQRLMSAGHGGQILVSDATEKLLREKLSDGASLRNMGEHRFKDVPHLICVYQVSLPGLQSEFPHLRTLDARPNNLSAQLTSFIGREKELADVRRLLQHAHMLTLIGPGGTGKTRLSIQAASEMLDQYQDGVWLVELAAILDPLLVPRTTGIAIGLRDEPQRPIVDMLCDYLREKRMLIILDNCEHLVDACAQMADRLLHAAPMTRILASSREALGIGGEVTYRVPSLGLPDVNHLPPVESLSQYEAVKLFIDRATYAIPTFAVTNENAADLAQICHRLDGIPLAIELAAAKIRVLSLEQIAGKLDDRFRLLTGGSRTALARHQTLRAAIDWSYNLLSPVEQILFQRLSVFVGGWTLEAAESVCSDESIPSDDVLNVLEQLINKSLVSRDEEESRSRYRMLETIRQYANEKRMESGESDTLRERHLAYFLKLAETAAPHVIRTEQLKWLAQLESDHENLRSALEWALRRDTAEYSLSLCAALSWFWELRDYWLEGLAWVTKALEKPCRIENRNEKAARARALYSRAQLEWRVGNSSEQILFPAQESLALALELSNRQDIAIAKFFVGVTLNLEGKDDEGLALMEECFAEFRAHNDLFWQAKSFPILNFLNEKRGKPIDHQHSLALELARKAGERGTLGAILLDRAWLLAKTNQFDEAKALLDEAETIDKQLGLQNYSDTAIVFAEIAWLEGNTLEARSLYTRIIEHFELLGEKFYRYYFTGKLGLLVMEQGDLDQARIHLEQALAHLREAGVNFHIARRLVELSTLSYLQGNLLEFKRNFDESLAFKDSLLESHKAYILMTILGALYVQKPECSAQFLGVIDRYCEQENVFPYTSIEKRYCGLAEISAREQLGDDAFDSEYRQGQKMSLDEALDLALKTVEEIE